MIILEILAVLSYIGVGVLCFWAGMRYNEDHHDEKMSARVIRPAVIVVRPQYHVTEYSVNRAEQLDLDFPPVKKVG